MVQYWVKSYMSSPAWDYQATAVRNAPEIIPRVKRGVRVSYTLYTVPSVKIYATREWSCDYVSLYRASIWRTGDERELSFGDICARRTHSRVHWARTLLRTLFRSAYPKKERERERCEVTKKKKKKNAPTYHLDRSRYQGSVIYSNSEKFDGSRI